MNLHEMNERLTVTKATEEQMWQVMPLYYVLDLHKDDFCKIVDAVGIDTLTRKTVWWGHVSDAVEESEARQRYVNAKCRLKKIESDRVELEAYVKKYEHEHVM